MSKLENDWIAALRSGKYAQTKGRLRDQKGFCCLGVLCDVYDPNGWDMGSYTHMGTSIVPHVQIYTSLRNLSPSWIRDRNERIQDLPSLNDSGEFTFDQIADIIQAKLNGWNLLMESE